jgi:hypothetical protein
MVVFSGLKLPEVVREAKLEDGGALGSRKAKLESPDVDSYRGLIGINCLARICGVMV